MTRHFRFKFACEVLGHLNGCPPEIDVFPSEKTLANWKALFLMDGVGFEEWYIIHMQEWSAQWKAVYGLPFHIEYLNPEERREK